MFQIIDQGLYSRFSKRNHAPGGVFTHRRIGVFELKDKTINLFVYGRFFSLFSRHAPGLARARPLTLQGHPPS
jgi:hypothetical protein